MQINTEYKLNEEVYLCFLEKDGLIRVTKVKIDEISIRDDGVFYYTKPWVGEDWEEYNLIPINNPELLIKRINELIVEEEENERNRSS